MNVSESSLDLCVDRTNMGVFVLKQGKHGKQKDDIRKRDKFANTQ